MTVKSCRTFSKAPKRPLPAPPPSGTLAFDFGPADALVGEGYVGIGADAYSPTVGHGWTDGALGVTDRGTAGALHRDAVTVVSASATFSVDLPNGVYYATVLMGDLTRIRDQMQLRFEPGTADEVVDQVTVASGDFHRQTYVVQVRDGQLNLELSDLGGVTGRAIIDALLISSAPLPGDSSDEQWIELYNRGNTTIELDGWQIGDAVDFQFPPDTSIAPGEYLVVTNDAGSLSARFPSIAGQIVGDFSRALANGNDRIEIGRASCRERV